MDFYQDSESVHSDGGIPVDLEGFPGSRKGKKREQMNKGMTTSKHIKCLKEWKGALGGQSVRCMEGYDKMWDGDTG